MLVAEEHGLRVAEVDADEIDGQPWRGAHIDVVRVGHVDPDAVGGLREQGFVVKPDWLTWLAPLGESREQFTATMTRSARQTVNRALRDVDADLRVDVHHEMRPTEIDAFLELYAERVETMHNGMNVAAGNRARFLGDQETYFAVYAYDRDELVGGCIVRECADEDAIRIRFSAVRPQWRRRSLSRALYLLAMDVGRSKGYRYATLGDDPNLYGHITQPGLFVFKYHLGFRAVPAHEFHEPDAHACAELFLSLDRLKDPSVVLAYPDAPSGSELSGLVLSRELTEVGPYDAPFLTGVENRLVPAGRP